MTDDYLDVSRRSSAASLIQERDDDRRDTKHASEVSEDIVRLHFLATARRV